MTVAQMTGGTVILMAVYNGAQFLPQQLASIAAQAGEGWRLIASDDGSTDDSRAVLAAFATAHPGRVNVVDGPQQGFAANFRALLGLVPPDAARAAFCDQDDVWHPDKLARAAGALSVVPDAVPALYAARTRLVDAALRPIGVSRGLPSPAGFGNALIQNIASGNTMVLNRAGLALMQAAATEAPAVPLHDWWAYQLVTGAGGRVLFDDRPALDYRQHGGNQIGSGRGFGALVRRAGRLLAGRSHGLMSAQSAALEASAHRLTPQAQARLAAFRRALAMPDPLRTALLLRRAAVYRQGWRGEVVLWCAVALGRV